MTNPTFQNFDLDFVNARIGRFRVIDRNKSKMVDYSILRSIEDNEEMVVGSCFTIFRVRNMVVGIVLRNEVTFSMAPCGTMD